MGGIERLWRRLLMIIGRGEIKLTEDAGVVQKAQVSFGPIETRDNTPRVAEYGFTSNPPAGTDCVVVFVGGDRDNGVIVATNNKNHRLKDLQPGEVAMHDNQGRWVWLKQSGIEIEANGALVNVKGASIATIEASTKVVLDTPLVECTGDVVADGISLKTHVHSGVTPGGGTTGAPV